MTQPGGAFQVRGGCGCLEGPKRLGKILFEDVEEFSEQNLIIVDSLQQLGRFQTGSECPSSFLFIISLPGLATNTNQSSSVYLAWRLATPKAGTAGANASRAPSLATRSPATVEKHNGLHAFGARLRPDMLDSAMPKLVKGNMLWRSRVTVGTKKIPGWDKLHEPFHCGTDCAVFVLLYSRGLGFKFSPKPGPSGPTEVLEAGSQWRQRWHWRWRVRRP